MDDEPTKSKDIGLGTKIKAKLFGGAVDSAQQKLTNIVADSIGRRGKDRYETAQNVMNKALEIRAREMGAPSNILLDRVTTAQWVRDHGGNPKINIEEANKIVGDFLLKK